MRTIKKKVDDLYLPDYVIRAIQNIDWIESTDDTITFHPDDFILIHYGTRGSTSYTGPGFVRYGSNTTCYQVFSPKLPEQSVYLGDGGSGILEASRVVTSRLAQKGLNPFSSSKEELAEHFNRALITFTHYHYDHLHLGLPLCELAHANNLNKLVIGSDNPKVQMRQAFRRPNFPRDFGEISSAYDFFELKDPRSTVLIFLPDGDFKSLDTSMFEEICRHDRPQIKHRGRSYHLSDCLVVRVYPLNHPDPCNSFRYENYDDQGNLTTVCTYVTDHEIQEENASDSYFIKQVKGSDYVYLDGQYDQDNYIAGFGHGRVEICGRVASKLDLPYVGIGHHDPSRTDNEIDAMITKAKEAYAGAGDKGARIVGASDRMLVFIPARSRNRSGVLFGRMDVRLGDTIPDDIGDKTEVLGDYKHSDLTSVYSTIDETVKL